MVAKETSWEIIHPGDIHTNITVLCLFTSSPPLYLQSALTRTLQWYQSGLAYLQDNNELGLLHVPRADVKRKVPTFPPSPPPPSHTYVSQQLMEAWSKTCKIELRDDVMFAH